MFFPEKPAFFALITRYIRAYITRLSRAAQSDPDEFAKDMLSTAGTFIASRALRF